MDDSPYHLPPNELTYGKSDFMTPDCFGAELFRGLWMAKLIFMFFTVGLLVWALLDLVYVWISKLI